MSEFEAKIAELREISQHPKKAVARAMQETGKKAVGCFPIYTPDEIIYAAGLLPIGMWGGPALGPLADKYLPSFCCSVMKANTEQALKGDYDGLSAVVVTAFCDTLKCIMENWKVSLPNLKVLPIVYPQNRKTEAGKAFFRAELERFAGALEEATGAAITSESLVAAVELYEEYRTAMREFVDAVSAKPGVLSALDRHHIIKAAYFMDKKDYIPKIRAVTEGVKAAEIPEKRRSYKKIILSGILCEPDALLETIDECGFSVAADDLAQETRQFRTAAPHGADGYARLVERLALQDGCAFLYDADKKRGAMLIELAKKVGVDGIVFNQLKFCDPEEFDWPIVKRELEEAGIPCLYLETEQQMDSAEQAHTRLQTFAETL